MDITHNFFILFEFYFILSRFSKFFNLNIFDFLYFMQFIETQSSSIDEYKNKGNLRQSAPAVARLGPKREF